MPAILYNVTINIDHSIASEWLKWMKEIHLPEVMSTGKFTGYRMLRLIGDEDSGGITYAIQYTAADMNHYDQYRTEFAPLLQAKTKEKFGDKFVAFRTLLEIVE